MRWINELLIGLLLWLGVKVVRSARVPLIGSLTSRKPNADIPDDTKDQLFVNCFPEGVQNPITGKKDIWLNKRQGTIASSDVQASATGHFGSVVWSSNSAATAPLVFSYIKSTATSIMFFNDAGAQIGGDVANTGACLFMSESDVGGTGNLTATLIDSGTNGWEVWFFPEGGAWTQITDGDFPTNLVATHTHMDGFMFVMTTAGRIYNSAVNSLSAWGANDYITANSFGDKGVGIARYGRYIVGFGDSSVEFFENAGNATGSVLRRLTGATLRVGARRTGQAEGASIKEVGDTVYWVGQNAASGAPGVYRLNGMQAEKVSNAAVDRVMGNGAMYIFGCFSLLGMTHVAFRSGAATSALCYCIETGFWWVFTPAGSLTLTAMIGALDTNDKAKSYFTTNTNAKFYTFDPSTPVWQDNSSAYTMTAQTDPLDLDTRRLKFWQTVHIIGDTESATSNLAVSYSDDDYATFSTARNIDLSSIQKSATGWGASRRRAWKFAHAANTACRIKAVEFEYEVGNT